MSTKSDAGSRAGAIAAVLLGFLLSGCGSGSAVSLDDAGFTAAAAPTCAALKQAIAVLPGGAVVDYYTAQADGYQKAADALAALAVTPASAPNGTAMRSGIVTLAQRNKALGAALDSALRTTGMTQAASLFISDDGHVFVYEDSVFHATALDVDPSLLTSIHTTQQQVTQAAGRLGLGDCAIDSWVPSAAVAGATPTPMIATPAPSTPAPTDTPAADTPPPAVTFAPPETPVPTAEPTPTPPPDPNDVPVLTLKGSGDATVPFTIPAGVPAIATIVESGSSVFFVESLASDGSTNDIIVSGVIGSYRGTHLFDADSREHSVAFGVRSDGSWTITIKPITAATKWNGTSAVKGTGASVLYVTGEIGDSVTLTITHRGSAAFSVSAYTADNWALLVNEIGSFSGVASPPAGTILVEIEADGAWTITPG